MGGVHVAPFPYRSSFPSAHPAADEASYVEQALDQLELVLKQQSTPSETCAMLIEPQLGEGGYVPAPLGFLRGPTPVPSSLPRPPQYPGRLSVS